MSSSPGISAFPKNDSNLFEWAGTIEGAAGTIYAGLTFRISISFPSNYPYTAPAIKFDTPCYHPNVDIQSGAICLDILQARILSSAVVFVLKRGARTSGLLFIVYKRSSCLCSHCWEVSSLLVRSSVKINPPWL
ncbi:ubiquitin-conjugating enzyme-domain-containing protein [Lanmaoa asiatica]|nr:ubiquitin-conjugating enzyme-domain-containing protein [Lanmaoa asiatica]